MDSQVAVDLGHKAILTALTVASPMLLVGIVIGLLIGLLQALTQIQDQTIASVPKIATMILALGICLPWLIEHMMQFTQEVLESVPDVVSGRSR